MYLIMLLIVINQRMQLWGWLTKCQVYGAGQQSSPAGGTPPGVS